VWRGKKEKKEALLTFELICIQKHEIITETKKKETPVLYSRIAT
jgi:hypothetical protein